MTIPRWRAWRMRETSFLTGRYRGRGTDGARPRWAGGELAGVRVAAVDDGGRGRPRRGGGPPATGLTPTWGRAPPRDVTRPGRRWPGWHGWEKHFNGTGRFEERPGWRAEDPDTHTPGPKTLRCGRRRAQTPSSGRDGGPCWGRYFQGRP